MGNPVGPNEAVDAELCIVDGITKVTTIAPCLHIIALHVLHFVQQPLVYPIPDEPPLSSIVSSLAGSALNFMHCPQA